jgi:hypothetical protein
MITAVWTHLRMFLNSKFYYFTFKCWILLKPVLGGVDGNLHFPVPSMNRLNQTEPATFSMLPCWAFFRDSVFIFFKWTWSTCEAPPSPGLLSHSPVHFDFVGLLFNHLFVFFGFLIRYILFPFFNHLLVFFEFLIFLVIILILFGVRLGFLSLVLVAGSCWGCVHWTPPILFIIFTSLYNLQRYHGQLLPSHKIQPEQNEILFFAVTKWRLSAVEGLFKELFARPLAICQPSSHFVIPGVLPADHFVTRSRA